MKRKTYLVIACRDEAPSAHIFSEDELQSEINEGAYEDCEFVCELPSYDFNEWPMNTVFMAEVIPVKPKAVTKVTQFKIERM